MAVEKIYAEIKKLSPMDRYKLRMMLETEEISEDDIQASKLAAGGWDNIDAEKMIEDIYSNRIYNPGRMDVDW
jgi:hypothetical protein